MQENKEEEQEDNGNLYHMIKRDRNKYENNLEQANFLKKKLKQVESKIENYVQNVNDWLYEQTYSMLTLAKEKQLNLMASVTTWDCCNIHLVKIKINSIDDESQSINVKLVEIADASYDVYCNDGCLKSPGLWNSLIELSDGQLCYMSRPSIVLGDDPLPFITDSTDWRNPATDHCIRVNCTLHPYYLVAFLQLAQNLFDFPLDIISIIATFYHGKESGDVDGYNTFYTPCHCFV